MKPMTSNAAKQCHLCGKRQLTKAERMGTLDDAGPKGTIDQSAQRSIIRTRLNLLHKKENNHCIVLYLSGEQRIHVDSYATPGFAKHFMEGLSIGGNVFGDVIKDTFKTAYKEYQKTDTGNSVQTSTLDASDASQSSSSAGSINSLSAQSNVAQPRSNPTELESQDSFTGVSSLERNPNDTGLSISEPATTVTDSLLERTQNLCPSVPVQSISTRSCSTTGQPSTSNPDSQIQFLPTTQKQYIVVYLRTHKGQYERRDDSAYIRRHRP